MFPQDDLDPAALWVGSAVHMSEEQSNQTAPPSCQELLKPLDHILPQDLEGKWTLVAGGMNNTAAFEYFKQRDSLLMNFFTVSGMSLNFTKVSGFNESCQYVDAHVTLSGSGFLYHQYNITLMHSTCPDCLVVHYQKQDQKPMRLDLFSRRREVDQDEMEEFKAQVECMKLSYVAVLDPTKKLCPEQINQTISQTPNA
ncbi:hypothetical protein WMY93_006355 [Mugilogobius chulae]|uniref:Apolipoprotein M n=1 Tax=Mugilogobius chulae TaxID=88201 RepID=A0AAW0PJR6_9GOBI